MKYSYTWLQSHIEQPLPKPEVLKEKIIFGAFEVESTEQVGDDTIFDIKVLPDRAGDCLSHYGMAREIAGLLNLSLKSTERDLPAIDLLLPVEVKSDLVRRYMAIRMDGVKVMPSPAWLKDALESVGQRSINNIVDATNFILLDTGQPTHAYDAAKIDGGIVVRDAHEGEKMLTLSDEEKILHPENLVIADYVGALAIAGVKGGKSAEIEDSTTSIILEIANFDPGSVRKTARALGLPTDAAKRFENNLSPEVAYQVAAQLVSLIKDIAGGEVTGVTDIFPNKLQPRTLSFSVDDIIRFLGESVTDKKIATVFDQYHYTYTYIDGVFTLTGPVWRRDITGAHDIAEEIGRVMGYGSIVPKPLPELFAVAHAPIYQSIRAAKAWLVHDGYREVMTYTFVKKGEVEVARGSKGKSALRTNLSDGLKESYDLNKQHAALLGASEIQIFEIGAVFPRQDQEVINVGIADAHGIKEMTLDAYIAEHKIVVETTSLEIEPYATPFVPWSIYPYITRDIAVWIAVPTDESILTELLTTFARQYCASAPVVFDQFEKDGKKSIAYRLVFQAHDRTLTDTEVEGWMSILVSEIVARGVFEIR